MRQETGDCRRETGEGRREPRDGGLETGRQKTGERWQTGEGRQEKGDGKQGDRKQGDGKQGDGIQGDGDTVDRKQGDRRWETGEGRCKKIDRRWFSDVISEKFSAYNLAGEIINLKKNLFRSLKIKLAVAAKSANWAKNCNFRPNKIVCRLNVLSIVGHNGS